MNIQEHPDGVAIKVRVQPRAARNEISGLFGDALRLRLTAPPVDGAANASCIEFFAGLFKIPKSQIEIISGLTGRNKIIKLYGVKRDEVTAKLGIF